MIGIVNAIDWIGLILLSISGTGAMNPVSDIISRLLIDVIPERRVGRAKAYLAIVHLIPKLYIAK